MRDRYDFSGNFENANIAITTYASQPEIDLGDAVAHIARMPTDRVPEPSFLPEGSSVPWRSNEAMTGRDPDLLKLASHCASDATNGLTIGICGMAGLGKTQLASEFCHRYGQYFLGGVFWLQCSDPEAIGSEFAAIGVKLNIRADYRTLAMDDQIALTKQAFETPLPRLLIMDGCEDEKCLSAWQPNTGGCRVVLTARKSDWSLGSGVKPLELATLKREDSVSLLRLRRLDIPPSDEAVSAIAAELGDLPLALHLASNFLGRYRTGAGATPQRYLAALRENAVLTHRSLNAEGWSPTGHEQNVARTFAVSLDQLNPADPLGEVARYLLRFASQLAPDAPIPKYILAPDASAIADVREVDMASLARQEEALLKLADLGLLSLQSAPEGGRQDDSTVVIHTLISAFANQAIEDDFHGDSITEIAEHYLLDLSWKLGQFHDPRATLPVMAHLSHVAKRATLQKSVLAATIQNVLGELLYDRGDSVEAEKHFKAAIEIASASETNNSASLFRAKSGLALTLRSRGHLDDALELQREIYEHSRTCEPDAEHLPVTLYNLAFAQMVSDQRAAIPLLLDLIVLAKQRWREAGTDRFKVYQALTMMLRGQAALGRCEMNDDPAKASADLRICVARTEALFGPRGLDRWQPLVSLAQIELRRGNSAKAVAHCRDAVDTIKERQGGDAGALADALTFLGHALIEIAGFDEARIALEHGIALAEKHVGRRYPGIRQAVLDLGFVYCSLNRANDARSLFKNEVKFLDTQPYSPSDLAAVLKAYSIAHHLAGDREGAEDCLERLRLLVEEQLASNRGAP